MSVASFEAMPNDMSAMWQGTKVLDVNGDPCAIIKIQTSEKGFTFDVGSLGVVKTEEKVGEIWVYVPFGVKRITLHHPTLQPITYNIPISVDKGRVYKMELTTDNVIIIRKQAVTQQFVVFNLTPKDAMVELDGQLLKVEDGVASKLMKFGTYNYKVQSPDYFSQTGTITVQDAKNKTVVDVVLKSSKSQVSISVANNAEIWVNGEKKGTSTWNGVLGAGEYLFEAKLNGHRSTSQSASIGESEKRDFTLPTPIPMYGSLTVQSSPANAKVSIDGVEVGGTPLMLSEVLVGTHNIEVSKNNYQTATDNITIVENQTFDYSKTLTALSNNSSASNSANTEFSGNSRTFTIDGVSFTMIPVKAGTFTMGATSEQVDDAYDDEKPAHQVTLTEDYYIGETEVTQALWKAVTGYCPTSGGSQWSSFYGLGDNYPAYYISYNDVLDFIDKLNQKTGKTFRMPTEAEWEYAARGGSKSNGYKYSGNNTIDDVAWYTDNSSSNPHAVKTKSPNELGIYDMSGNVYEWCSDWYGSSYYSSSFQTDPKGPVTGSLRVGRGGSWRGDAGYCRVSFRLGITPDGRYGGLGFRLCLSE